MLNRQPLRRQVVVTASLILLGLLVGATWAGNETRRERRDEIGAQAASLVASVSTSLDQYLVTAYAVGSALSRQDALRTLAPEPSHRLLASVLREQPWMANIVLADSDGRLLVTAESAAPRQLTVLDFGREALQGNRPVLSDLFVASTSGEPTVVLAYPLRNDAGDPIGLIGMSLDLRRVQDAFNSIPLPQGSVVTVMDRKGRIVARTHDPGRFVGQQGVFAGASADSRSIRDLDGVERIAADAFIRRVPWRVSVGIPQSEVADRTRGAVTRNLLLLALLLSAVIVAAVILLVPGTRRLEDLTSQARRIAEGDLAPPPATTMPNLELQQLQEAFVAMAARLREARRSVQQQVEQERQMNQALQSLQRHLVRQERQAAVGHLMRGVAHEMNNPLQAILGTAQLLERQPGLSVEAREEIAFVQSQAVRAREIIRSLSRFDAAQVGPPEPVDLREIVVEVLQLRAHDAAASDIRINADSQTSACVSANFTELARVVLNLVTNAEQALTKARTPSAAISIRLFDVGQRVRVEVADNGPGVSCELEPRLFQPFVTTRRVGEGPGLGLSLSHGIIQSYGGTIGYYRNESGGSTFYFELPAVISDHHAQDRTAVLPPPSHSGV